VFHITLYFYTGLLIKLTSTVYLQAASKCEEMNHSSCLLLQSYSVACNHVCLCSFWVPPSQQAAG